MTDPAFTHLQMELDKLKACIHCGMCLPACPTYRATGSEAESPRGRLYLMKKLLDGEYQTDQVAPHLDQCLACHGCETVCPSGVQYGRVLLGTREDLASKNKSPYRALKRWAFSRLLTNRKWLQTLGNFGRFYQQSRLQTMVRNSRLLKLIPNLATRESLMPTVPKRRELHPGMSFGNPSGERVALLIGCVMDIFYNPIHWDTIDVLAANNYYVTIPEQTCCGALAHHAGETDITRTLAIQNIQLMEKANPEWIVVNSAGCGSSMKEYAHLLAGDPVYGPKAAAFSAKVVDIMELLAKKKLARFAQPMDLTITYHAACHLYHVQKVKAEPIEVLAQIPGVVIVPLTEADACCGSAGIYNIEHPELSGEVLAMKTNHLKTANLQGATTVVTGNPGCLLQLEKGVRDAGLPLRVRHPVEVLAEAYRGGTFNPKKADVS